MSPACERGEPRRPSQREGNIEVLCAFSTGRTEPAHRLPSSLLFWRVPAPRMAFAGVNCPKEARPKRGFFSPARRRRKEQIHQQPFAGRERWQGTWCLRSVAEIASLPGRDCSGKETLLPTGKWNFRTNFSGVKKPSLPLQRFQLVHGMLTAGWGPPVTAVASEHWTWAGRSVADNSL